MRSVQSGGTARGAPSAARPPPRSLRASRTLPRTALLGCGALLLVLALGPCKGTAPDRTAPSAPTQPPAPQEPFRLSQVFFGAGAYANPAVRQNLDLGMLNAYSFGPPLDAGMQRFLAQNPAAVVFTMAAASRVERRSADDIEAHRRALAQLRSGGVDASWNLMEEWDQGGGAWVSQGRPSYAGMTREQAHAAFTSYYLDRSPPLGSYLRQSAGERGVPFVAQTDYPMNAFYGFAMGVDVCLLERGIDELSDLSTGIAFVRGAARQFGKRWGIDLSLWRTGNESATEFDAHGALTGGWSPSYVRRHLYAAYVAGARAIQLEPSQDYGPDGRLNPLGEATREFADFALRRHPDLGTPVVTTAALIPYHAGFDAKHWMHAQADAVWYGDIPYSDGDRMLDNLLKVAFPRHWLHGLAPGAPFADASGAPVSATFRQFLRAGGDPRPYEPMATTRWGDNLDVIADNASLDVLRAYKVVVLVGDVVIGDSLREALRTWVSEGGTLVANVAQVTSADEALLGVQLGGGDAAADRSLWLADGAEYDEPPFTVSRVSPRTATVVAASGGQDALVTAQAVGRGRVILTTARHLQSSAGDQLLRIGVRLLDELASVDAPAQVAGAPIEYVVSRAADRTVVALVNSSGASWTGTVSFGQPPPSFALKEYLADVDVPNQAAAGKAAVAATVPPYDVRIYAMEAR